MFRRIALAFGFCALPCLAGAQTLVSLAHPAPEGADITLQMTDGTVLGHSASNQSNWYKLTPDINGSYVNGTWVKVAALPQGYSPYAFASAVLADGRLIMEGGEYNPDQNFSLTNLGAIYDPVANTWTAVKPPKGAAWKHIGDSSSLVLPDGRYLVGEKLSQQMAALDPKTLTWTDLGSTGKRDFNSEETWTLMPDGRIMAEDVKKGPNTEIYDPSTGAWTSAGKTPVKLNGPPCCSCFDYGAKKPYCPPGEIGPALLMPDGSIFATGSTPEGESIAHTAIFRNGKWKQGPDFPRGDEAGDSFGSLLPNGHAVIEGVSGQLYEFDGTNLTREPVNASGNSLMVLPTGEILVGGGAVYRSSGTSDPSWAPTITSVPATLTRGQTFQISGTQFNGLSQANSFGDELQTFTNYPLVRITNNASGHVFYAKTHDHSTMAVATGSAVVSTNFDVPSGMETGASSLVVVANGIPSTAVSVTVN
jgi:hypothetical protein